MSVRLSFIFSRLLTATLLLMFSSPLWAYETTVTLKGKNIAGQQIEIALNRAEIEQLPQSSLSTHLPWFKGQAKFQGVKLKTLLDIYQIKSPRIKMSALNEYSAEISWEEIEKYDPIVAIRKDGEYMKIRDFGPYWLVLSIDQYPELKRTEYLAKMVWQLETIQAE